VGERGDWQEGAVSYRPPRWAGEIEDAAHELGYFLEAIEGGIVILHHPTTQARITVASVLVGPGLLRELLRPDEKALQAWFSSVPPAVWVTASTDATKPPRIQLVTP